MSIIPKPVWSVGFALEQTLRDATLAVFSFLILKRLQHIIILKLLENTFLLGRFFVWTHSRAFLL
jgi:hypothetical protein